MPAPKRVNLVLGSLVVSAFILPGVWNPVAEKPVCSGCAPKRTRMKEIAHVAQFKTSGDIEYLIYACENCGRQWAALVGGTAKEVGEA